jgi:hypothetical protein
LIDAGHRGIDISVDDRPVALPRFRLGNTLSRSFRLWTDDFRHLLVIGGTFLLFWVVMLSAAAWAIPEAALERVSLLFVALALYLGAAFVSIATVRTHRTLDGSRPRFRASMREGIAYSLRVFLIYLILHVTSTILANLLGGGIGRTADGTSDRGFPLDASDLVVLLASLYFAAAFWVAAPASIIENENPFRSLKRSWGLSRRNRWRIMGVIAVLAAIGAGYGFGLQGLLHGFSETGIDGIRQPTPTWPVLLVPWFLALFLGFFVVLSLAAVVSTVTYHELRRVEEARDST